MRFVFLLIAVIIFVRFYDTESAPASIGRKGVEHKMRRVPRWYPKPENMTTIKTTTQNGNETQEIMENVTISSNSLPENVTGVTITPELLQADLPPPIGDVQKPPTNTTLKVKGHSSKQPYDDEIMIVMIFGVCFVSIFLVCYIYSMARASALKKMEMEREEGAIYFDAPRTSRFNVGLQQVRNYMAKK
ncbi:unnamed protein product [Orchesella dallaii]|uniref:Uncharacterized protein n=1 Tax=Orchesella dallaii TaxID=48710 RepID=A0ABP1RKC3_9HEXA